MFIEQLWLNSIYFSLFFNQQSSKMLQIFTEEPKFSKIKIPLSFPVRFVATEVPVL